MHTAQEYGTNKPAALIYWRELESPVGDLYIAVGKDGLRAIGFGRHEKEFFSNRKFAGKMAKEVDGTDAAAAVAAQLQEYFAGKRKIFDLPLDLSALTPFQREVLTTTSRIPWGETWSYQQIAAQIGRAKASRPVGQALGRNPIPIVIPCHRVIASGGGLGGYCGESGLDIKRWLLRHEGALS